MTILQQTKMSQTRISNTVKRVGRQWTWGALLIVASLASCTDQKPQGQVIATVNGKEITSQDLQAEYRATGINNAPQLLRNVIDRKLLSGTVQDAPSDPSDLVRAKEALRAQRAIQQLSKGFSVPNDAEVKAFIESHPQQFRDRELIQINQISVADPHLKDNVKNVQTMADAERELKRLDAKFKSEHRMLDTLELPPQMIAIFNQAKPNDVSMVANDKQLVLFTVEGRTPVKLTDGQQAELAKNILTSQNAKKKVSDAVVAMEKSAKIEYKDNKMTGKAADAKASSAKEAAPANAVAPAAPAAATAPPSTVGSSLPEAAANSTAK